MAIWRFLNFEKKNFTVFSMSLSQISSEFDDFFKISSQLPLPPGFKPLFCDSIGIIMMLMQFWRHAFNVGVVVLHKNTCVSAHHTDMSPRQ